MFYLTNDSSYSTKIDKRTKTVNFIRQLWPQPPEGSTPRWYLINTVGFFKNGEKVWEQEIPEADLKKMVVNRFGFETLDHPGHGFHLEHDETWGWLLHFTMTHEEADKIWKFISNRDNFYNVYDSSQPRVMEEES